MPVPKTPKPPPRTKPAPPRIQIVAPTPMIDCGRFPAKRTAGESVQVGRDDAEVASDLLAIFFYITQAGRYTYTL